MKATWIAILLAGAGLAAAEPPTALTEAEIAAAVVGKAFPDGDGEIVVVSGSPHRFCPNGTYWAAAHRVPPATGTYDIGPGRLCTDTARGRQCRYLFRDAAGRVLMSLSPDGAGAWAVTLTDAHCPS